VCEISPTPWSPPPLRQIVAYLNSVQAKVDRIKSLQVETATEVKMLLWLVTLGYL
jgi:hypothetical protein